MLKKLLSVVLGIFSSYAFAQDWNGASAPIETMYIYPTHAVIVQGGNYAGRAGCTSGMSAWSFNWSDFDVPTQQRIYSTLLAAKMAKAPIKPVFTDVGCGPEGYKKFNGQFVF